MRVLLVLELDVLTTAELPAVVEHIDPPNVPHFSGALRVVVDPAATQMLAWLDE